MVFFSLGGGDRNRQTGMGWSRTNLASPHCLAISPMICGGNTPACQLSVSLFLKIGDHSQVIGKKGG